MAALLLALLVVATPFPPGRYCVTPLGGNATAGVYVLKALVSVAPEKASAAKGALITLKFATVAEAKDGARGACWKLKAAPTTEKRPGTYVVVGSAP